GRGWQAWHGLTELKRETEAGQQIERFFGRENQAPPPLRGPHDAPGALDIRRTTERFGWQDLLRHVLAVVVRRENAEGVGSAFRRAEGGRAGREIGRAWGREGVG